MNCPTTNGRARSSAIHRTFRHYRFNKLIFIKPALKGFSTSFPISLPTSPIPTCLPVDIPQRACWNVVLFPGGPRNNNPFPCFWMLIVIMTAPRMRKFKTALPEPPIYLKECQNESQINPFSAEWSSQVFHLPIHSVETLDKLVTFLGVTSRTNAVRSIDTVSHSPPA